MFVAGGKVKCPKCGATVKAGDSTCKKCGMPLPTYKK